MLVLPQAYEEKVDVGGSLGGRSHNGGHNEAIELLAHD